MKIQIIKHDKFLKQYWNVHLWSIHEVVKKEEFREGTYYYIKSVYNFGNYLGQKTIIRIRKSECAELCNWNEQLDSVYDEICEWVDAKIIEVA